MFPAVNAVRLVSLLFPLLTSLAPAGGCAPQPAGPQRSSPQTVRLQPWSGRMAEAFPDHIDRGSLDTGSAPIVSLDPMLRSRTQGADFIFRARVTAYRAERGLDGVNYHLSVVPVGPPVSGNAPDAGSFDLVVRSSNPFSAVVAGAGNNLVNRTFLAYLKRFAGDRGPELHWYMSGESAELVASIRKTHLLMEVRASSP